MCHDSSVRHDFFVCATPLMYLNLLLEFFFVNGRSTRRIDFRYSIDSVYRVVKMHRMPDLLVSFRKRATNYRARLRKMTQNEKASYGFSPPCSADGCGWLQWKIVCSAPRFIRECLVLMGAGVCHDTFCAPRLVGVLVCWCAVACLMHMALLMSIRAPNDWNVSDCA